MGFAGIPRPASVDSIFGIDTYAPLPRLIALKMYSNFAELLTEHSLDGYCRRTVWNRHFPDHHSLLVVIDTTTRVSSDL